MNNTSTEYVDDADKIVFEIYFFETLTEAKHLLKLKCPNKAIRNLFKNKYKSNFSNFSGVYSERRLFNNTFN